MTPPNVCRLTDAQKEIALERIGVIQRLIDLPARTKQDVSRSIAGLRSGQAKGVASPDCLTPYSWE
jgi:hypothetical protein